MIDPFDVDPVPADVDGDVSAEIDGRVLACGQLLNQFTSQHLRCPLLPRWVARGPEVRVAHVSADG